MEMNSTNHGFIGRPGAINAGLLEKAIRLSFGRTQSQLDAATLEEAQGPARITFRIRKERPKPAAPANRYGRRVSLGARTFASAADQRAYWVDLIAKNQKK
jgi:hypothetical protein